MSVLVVFVLRDDELTSLSPLLPPLVWLRPSKQIRAPIYNIKVRKQRRAILIKYIPLYIIAIAIFVALVATRELPSFFASWCDAYILCRVLPPAPILRSQLDFTCSICDSL